MANTIQCSITKDVAVKGEWFNEEKGVWEVEMLVGNETFYSSNKEELVTVEGDEKQK